MATLRRHTGRIRYRRAGDVVGSEDFDIDVRENGRTVRAYCEMAEGALTRDASWTLDRAHRPVEGHVRVVQNGALTGSAWYHFDDAGVNCEAFTADRGRVSQRFPGRARYLGLHPLIGDGLIALARGKGDRGVAEEVESITCSYDINGETSLLALPIRIAVSYLGDGEMTVPAGTFQADRYALRWQPRWPPAKLWVHGEDALFLKLEWEVSGLISELERLATIHEARSPRFAAV